MPRFHIGLVKHAPMQSITLAGHAFQKETWRFGEDGNYDRQDGLVIEVDDVNFERAVLADAGPRLFRVVRDENGKVLRADEHDSRINGFRRSTRDERVSDYVYVKKVDESFRATPTPLTEPEAKPELVPAGARKAPAKAKKSTPSSAAGDLLGPGDVDDPL